MLCATAKRDEISMHVIVGAMHCGWCARRTPYATYNHLRSIYLRFLLLCGAVHPIFQCHTEIAHAERRKSVSTPIACACDRQQFQAARSTHSSRIDHDDWYWRVRALRFDCNRTDSARALHTNVVRSEIVIDMRRPTSTQRMRSVRYLEAHVCVSWYSIEIFMILDWNSTRFRMYRVVAAWCWHDACLIAFQLHQCTSAVIRSCRYYLSHPQNPIETRVSVVDHELIYSNRPTYIRK